MKTEDYIFGVCFFLAILGFIGSPLGLVFLFLNMLYAAVWSFLGAVGALSICGFLCAMFGDGVDSDDYYYHSVNSDYESKSEDNSEKIIIIKNTRCCACGAPLEDDTCSYCNTKAVIYKKIR